MNKTFKTIWNDARRCYIVANEAQKSHGKPSKSAVALAVAATAVLTMGAAQAAYVEQGLKATASFNVDAAVASWETDEYQADWGLAAMNASKAYALGFTGQGVTVGVMDSGALLQAHPDLAGDRFHASEADSHQKFLTISVHNNLTPQLYSSSLQHPAPFRNFGYSNRLDLPPLLSLKQ